VRTSAVAVHVGEEQRAEELAPARRALARDLRPLPGHGRVALDRPVAGGAENDPLVRPSRAPLERTGVVLGAVVGVVAAEHSTSWSTMPEFAEVALQA
jgi:hypothetical protein